MCLQAYRHYHVATGHMYTNTAICYEDCGELEKTYDHFRTVYHIKKEIFGLDHVRTKRTQRILSEPKYMAIARQRNDTDILALSK